MRGPPRLGRELRKRLRNAIGAAREGVELVQREHHRLVTPVLLYQGILACLPESEHMLPGCAGNGMHQPSASGTQILPMWCVTQQNIP